MLKSSVLCKHFRVEKPSLNQPMCHKQLNLFAGFFKMEFSSADPVRSKSSANPGLTENGRGPTGCPATPHTTIGKWETPFPCSRPGEVNCIHRHSPSPRQGGLCSALEAVKSETSFWAVFGRFLFASQGIGDQTPSLCCEISSQVQLVAVSVADPTAT